MAIKRCKTPAVDKTLTPTQIAKALAYIMANCGIPPNEGTKILDLAKEELGPQLERYRSEKQKLNNLLDRVFPERKKKRK